MNKVNLCVLVCSLLSVPLGAEPATNKADDCPAAVDAADSMNVNRQGCDYSKEGLNSVLHRVFNKSEEGARLDTAAAPEPRSSAVAEVGIDIQLRLRLADIGQAALGKNQLLAKALLACPQGFQVNSESYKPQAKQALELILDIRCLSPTGSQK